MRRLLLLSSSKMQCSGLFEWCADIVKEFLAKNSVKKVLFVPYAVRDNDEYAKTFQNALEKLGIESESIHTKEDPVKAVLECEAIFIGGGNTFLLLKTLYEKKLLEPIRKAVLKNGIPLIGSSAGTNVATRSIHTTNDMPICFPPSFDALGLVPFNINPHYPDADPDFTICEETREKRISEFLEEPTAGFVLGLREGCCLEVEGDVATLKGLTAAWLFNKGQEPAKYEPGSDMSFLLKSDDSLQLLDLIRNINTDP